MNRFRPLREFQLALSCLHATELKEETNKQTNTSTDLAWGETFRSLNSERCTISFRAGVRLDEGFIRYISGWMRMLLMW